MYKEEDPNFTQSTSKKGSLTYVPAKYNILRRGSTGATEDNSRCISWAQLSIS